MPANGSGFGCGGFNYLQRNWRSCAAYR